MSEAVKVSLIDSLSPPLLVCCLFECGCPDSLLLRLCSLALRVFQHPSVTLLPFISWAANHAEDCGNLVSVQVSGQCCTVCQGSRVGRGAQGSFICFGVRG